MNEVTLKYTGFPRRNDVSINNILEMKTLLSNTQPSSRAQSGDPERVNRYQNDVVEKVGLASY